MAYDKKSSSDENDGGTRVDLGDDLLADKTVVVERPAELVSPDFPVISQGIPEVPLEGPGSIEDLLQSAKILVSEGLVEDAKKILRQILIAAHSNALAQQLLDEIHNVELKHIFGEEETRRPYGRKVEQSLGEIDAEALMRQLDRDLNLGIFSEESAIPKSDPGAILQEPDMINSICGQLEKKLANGTVQDWIDLSIAFLEMELYAIAIRLLMGAFRRLDPDNSKIGELTLSITCLLVLALILAGRPFEAISRIQPILQDVEIKRENKIELFYLMGRTYESMKKFELAFQFYQQVIEIDPHYRDVDQRLRKKH